MRRVLLGAAAIALISTGAAAQTTTRINAFERVAWGIYAAGDCGLVSDAEQTQAFTALAEAFLPNQDSLPGNYRLAAEAAVVQASTDAARPGFCGGFPQRALDDIQSLADGTQ